MKKIIFFSLCLIIAFTGCKKDSTQETDKPKTVFIAQFSEEPIPADLEWLTNDSDLTYASPDAVKGGKIRYAIQSFPLTFRTVGPDTNSSFRSYILDNQLSLINMHPNTENIIPELATHWAYGKDGKTVYFKLNKKAEWSDGKPVTAHDYAYVLQFMRSEHIVAPWYNEYYTREIEDVIVYDEYTIAVVATKKDPDLILKVGLSPLPRHFYGELDENYVMEYNWKIPPNTGPYQIVDFKKGKYVTFKRKDDWWAKDLKYFKNRFNVDKVVLTVIKDESMEWEYFKKGQIDYFSITAPLYWHEKSNSQEFKNGYIHKIWYYYDMPQSQQGIYLNQSDDLFKDINVRYAFSHAMNIQKVIENVLRNDYYRLENGYVGFGEYSNNTIKARRFDLEKVTEYMEKSDWIRGSDGIWTKDGKRFSVSMTYSADRQTRRLVVLKEEALKAGLELLLDKLDSATAFKKISEKKFQAASIAWGVSLRPRFWEHYHSVNANKPQTNNITNNVNKEMDVYIDQYRDSVDAEERKILSRKLQEYVHTACDFVPTYMVPYTREAYWRWFKLPEKKGTKQSNTLFSPFDTAIGGLFWHDENTYAETQTALKKKSPFEPVTNTDKTYMMDIIKD